MKRQRGYVIAGTGDRAQTYIQALTGPHRDVGRIVALCDPNPARADYYRSAYALHDVPVAPPEEFVLLLKHHRPDAVIVTSPDHTHDTYICGALDAGVDAITEKPMTIDEQRLRRIVAAARASARLTHPPRPTTERDAARPRSWIAVIWLWQPLCGWIVRRTPTGSGSPWAGPLAPPRARLASGAGIWLTACACAWAYPRSGQ